MLRVAQIVAASGYVQAVVRPSGPLVGPEGMIFVEIADDLDLPVGKYYADGAFYDEAQQ